MIKYHLEAESMFAPGEKVEHDAYFNLTRDEIVKMLGEDPSGNPIARLMAAKSGMTQIELYMTMRTLVLAAYGVPNSTKTGLRKNARLREDFVGGPFLDMVIDRIMENEDAAIAFFKSIVPSSMDISKAIDKAKKGA